MRRYDLVFIIHPDRSEEEVKAVTDKYIQILTAQKGTLIKTDDWGKRRLAYRVGKHEDGNYTLMYLECPPAAAGELERRYRMNKRVIKYLTVRMDRAIPEEQPAATGAVPEERPAAATEQQ